MGFMVPLMGALGAAQNMKGAKPGEKLGAMAGLASVFGGKGGATPNRPSINEMYPELRAIDTADLTLDEPMTYSSSNSGGPSFEEYKPFSNLDLSDVFKG